ncbi:MAG TPA: pilus assembly protein PilP [Povalibacter sp.]|nr:pilus assembly protein PilP [Povalibacter sp.]
MMQRKLIPAASLVLLCLGACSGDMDELQRKVADIKKNQTEHVEALPEVKPYETYAYNASSLRSPFVASAPVRTDMANALRPDTKRPREFLEQFPIDSMKMVGTLALQGKNYGLVQGKDGLVHRVLPGSYMGQNDGRVVGISPTRISIVEIVPDGLGGYIERPAALALTE